MNRTFGVLIEFNHGRELERVSEFIEFAEPLSLGPERTLCSIASNRVEFGLYAGEAYKTAGKNWKIISVAEIKL